METIVKKLNEIADAVAGEDVEDATNVADALVDIGNAFAGSEGEKVNNVVDALDYIKENVSGGGSGIEWRHFTYSCLEGSAETLYAWLPYYDANDQLCYVNATSLDGNTWGLSETLPAPSNLACKLPVINGKCEFNIACDMSVTLGDNSTGCTLEGNGDWHESEMAGQYKITITEDNANLTLYFEV